MSGLDNSREFETCLARPVEINTENTVYMHLTKKVS